MSVVPGLLVLGTHAESAHPVRQRRVIRSQTVGRWHTDCAYQVLSAKETTETQGRSRQPIPKYPAPRRVRERPCASPDPPLACPKPLPTPIPIPLPDPKPEMSIGQIHDAQNDLLEVTYVGPADANSIGTGDGLSDLGVIEAHFNNDTSVEALDAAYHLGDSMQVDISTDGAGNMNLTYRNDTTGASKSVTQKFYGSVSGGCYFKAGNYHQACTKLDINAAINASCAAKSWPAGRWETDSKGASVLELYELSAD